MSQPLESISWKTILVTLFLSGAAITGYKVVPASWNESPPAPPEPEYVGVYAWSGTFENGLEDVIVKGFPTSGGVLRAVPTGTDGFTEIEISPDELNSILLSKDGFVPIREKYKNHPDNRAEFEMVEIELQSQTEVEPDLPLATASLPRPTSPVPTPSPNPILPPTQINNPLSLVGQTRKYVGDFHNTTFQKTGNVSIDILFEEGNRISGYMNFNSNANETILCGAGEFEGFRNGNVIDLTFNSNDPDSECGYDIGWVFTVSATLSPDATSLAKGTFAIDNNGSGGGGNGSFIAKISE